MKKALITGVTGQDGSYLAEFLLENNYEVHGLIRRSSSFNTGRIDHIINEDKYKDSFFFHHGDLTDSSNINRILEKVEPDEIYNLAAQSHVKVSFELPDYTAQVDALGTLRFLDAIRKTQLNTKFYPYILVQSRKDLKFLNLENKQTIKISNNHLQYAVTWFVLGISIIIAFWFYRKK